MNYKNYIKSNLWKTIKNKLRQVYFSKRIKPACVITGSKKYLDVHHLSYNMQYGHEKIYDLIFIRKDYHEKLHNYLENNNLSLRDGSLKFIEENKQTPFTSYDLIQKYCINYRIIDFDTYPKFKVKRKPIKLINYNLKKTMVIEKKKFIPLKNILDTYL